MTVTRTGSGDGGIRAAVMRGGTSKGVFVAEADLPEAPAQRDDLILRIMGSPDPDQIDGLGAATATTSKFAYVGGSTRPGVDLEYAVAAVGVTEPIVDWSGTCGNLTAAVVPFALAAGLIERDNESNAFTLLNRSTGRLVRVTVELEDGQARTTGATRIDGVPSPGAPILCEYLDPAGGVLGSALPTGAPIDRVDLDGTQVPVTVVDVTHPYAFVPAGVLGGRETPAAVNADTALLARLERLRGVVAAALGLVIDPADAATRSPSVPRLVVVGPGVGGSGGSVVTGLALSMGRAIPAIPVTASLALAAAVTVRGSVPAQVCAAAPAPGSPIRIGHPAGAIEVSARWDDEGALRSVGILRTARMLSTGVVFPREEMDA
ncbi:PrpF domain-containing protein [Nocardia nova]|uniref:PrpF domain-containing protein n=1 Tax=Nocardia nova TaxID=37330 RepID=UPI003405F77A